MEKILDVKYPMFWGDFAIEQDYAKILIQKIIAKRPRVIVDLGAGNSSLVIAKTIKKLKIDCEIYSIDADSFVENDLKNVLIAEDVYNAENHHLIHAPLKKVRINGVNYNYYDEDILKSISFDKKIDLVSVDGPFGRLVHNPRYLALHYFGKHFNKKCTVLLDDSGRIGEKSVARKWCKEYDCTKKWYHDTERGIYELEF